MEPPMKVANFIEGDAMLSLSGCALGICAQKFSEVFGCVVPGYCAFVVVVFPFNSVEGFGMYDASSGGVDFDSEVGV